MKHLDFKILTLAGVALFMASCSEDPFGGEDQPAVPGGGSSNKICFMVNSSSPSRSGSSTESRRGDGAYIYANEGDSLYMSLTIEDIDDSTPASRASYITDQGINTLMMTCRSKSADGTKYYFSNTRFTNDGTAWISNPVYWWQNLETILYTFYGYAPAEIKGATYSEGTNFAPTLEYTTPANVKDQTDIVYNSITNEIYSTANMTVALKMEHALANVSFKCGTGMISGTINSVTLRGVNSHGILNLTDGTWSGVDTPADFTANTSKATTDNADITSNDDGTLFMLIPQSGTPTVDINLTTANGATRTYSGTINANWQAGQQYRYVITIGPDLNIDIWPDTQDAHYVIAKAYVNAEDLQAGQSWELTATASDGADVTLLHEGDLNAFQKNGFWIDKIIEGSTQTNARGTATLTGTASGGVSVFLPENVSDDNRTITLTLKMAGTERVIETKNFLQSHPAWTPNGFGWEQIKESDAQYGFDWDYRVCYAYLYTAARIGLDEKNRIFQEYLTSIINENNAGGYADVVRFDYSNGFRIGWRYYIDINYAKLSSLSGYVNGTDGLENTKELNKIAGAAVTNAFETVVANIQKTEDGVTGNAFRKGNGAKNEAPAPTGVPITSSPAIGAVLKKNRYNLKRTTTIIDGQPNVSEVPQLTEQGIVWYLPAVAQFSTIPSDILTPIEPGNCWSSNADTSSNANAYLGNNTLAGRKSVHGIRGCRNRP